MRILKTIFFLTAFFVSAYGQDRQVSIRLKKEAVILGPRIRLGEIGEVSTSHTDVKNIIKAVDLGPAPLPAKSKELSLSYIKLRLKQTALDPHSVIFHGPELIQVTTARQEIRRTVIQETVTRFVKARSPGDGRDISIDFRSVPEKIVIPKGEWNLEVQPLGETNLRGNLILYITIKVNGKYYKKIPVSLKVHTFEQVLVANRRILQYQIIQKEDVNIERKETTTLAVQPLRSIEEVVGKRSKVIINPGRLIDVKMVEIPPIIKRGELVKIVVQLKNIQASTSGKALENGRLNDLITVKNLKSRKRISARVMDSHTVIIRP